MNVLVTGADGFVGRHLVRALLDRGHGVIGCGRNRVRFAALFPQLPFVPGDFARDHTADVWMARLERVDTVINTVGIFREKAPQTFDAIHVRAPIALFRACAALRLRHVVNVSALGADAAARSQYHLSKKAADDFLANLDLDWTIVQPSLIYGPDGVSARWFNAMAAMPLIPLPGAGNQLLQPIHVGDAAHAIAALVQPLAPARRRLALVGPEPIALKNYLAALRAGLGLPPGRYVHLPLSLVRIVARTRVLHSLLTPESLDMLLRGNVASRDATVALLDRLPRDAREFIDPSALVPMRQAAYLAGLLPLLRWSIALVWIVSGVVSLGIYPAAQSYELLARTGVIGPWAPVVLYGAAALDIAIGVAILVLRRRRWLWQAQIALIAGYSLIIAWVLPEFWLHPFAPLVKNVPILVGIAMLWALED